MKKYSLFYVLFILSLILYAVAVSAIGNPAAKFCIDQGNKYEVKTDVDGSQYGVCIVEGEEINEWDYMESSQIRMRSMAVMKSSTVGPVEKQSGALINEGKKVSNSEGVPILMMDDTRTYSSTIDWRNYNGQDWTTSVKNQALCGSCWLFSSMGILEAAINKNLSNASYDIDLSEQDVLSCNSENTNGCSGGYEYQALNYSRDSGVTEESYFPYVQDDDAACSGQGAGYLNQISKVIYYYKLPLNENAIKQAINDYGPVTVYMVIWGNIGAVNCSSYDIDSVSTGIYTNDYDNYPKYCGLHSVALVGYSEVGQYWIVKNSWGTGWGDGGYFKVAYSETVPYTYDAWNSNLSDVRTLFIDDSYAVTSTISDADYDGVPNKMDNCPTVAGYAQYNGCIPITINSFSVTPDNFICALNGDASDINRNLSLIVNITNSTPITVSTNLSSVGLNSIYNLTYMNGRWNLTAAVINTVLYQFAQANIVLNVRDTLGTPVVGQNFTAVLLYNMTTPPTINNCERQGSAATLLCNIVNFSNVNFVIEIEKNGSSTCNGGQLPWNNTFQKVITINFTGIDMSSPTIGQRLQNLGSAIRPYITLPGQFGDSFIYVNSSAIQELNSSARITFYGLPFSQQPNIIGDGITVNSFALNTPYYIPLPTEMWIPNSNLTFTVGHFSQYNITDNIKPKISITAPTSGQQFSTSTVRLNVTVNGTGTQLYNITYKIDGVQVFSVSSANIFSQCHALSSSWDAVYCNYTATSLSPGTHNLTVIATDLGGGAGNTNTTSLLFTYANLSVDIVSPLDGYYYSTRTINLSITSNGDSTWYNWNGTNTTYSSSGLITFAETTSLSSPSTINVYTNNSESELKNDTVSFYVDTTAPRAVFTASTQTIYVGQNVSFYSAASDALVWINQSWNFGDGKTNFSNASTVSKTYNLAGTYTVNLTVKDRAGNTNSSIMAITVSNSYMTSTGTVPIVYPDASSTIINLNSTEVGYAVPNITATGNLTVPIIAIYGNVSPDTAINATSALSKIIKYLEINLSNTSWNDAGNSANVTFYIPNATLNELGLSPTDVTTFRYSAGTWTELATRVVDSTVDPLIFSFTTNHFTLFSIGKKTSSTPPSGGGGGGGTVFKAVSLNFTDGVSYIYDSKQGKQYSFTVGNIQKNLKIQTVASELVSFMLSSPMNFFQLGAGESMDFDFDADGDTDAIITLSAIDGKTIDFIVELPSLVPTQTIKEEKPSAKAITADVVKETVVENKQAAAAIAENSEVIVNSSTQPNSKNSIMISPAVKIGGIIILVIVIAVLIITVFKAIKEMPKQPPKQNIIQTQTTNTQATNKSNQNSEIDEYKKKLEEINKQL